MTAPATPGILDRLRARYEWFDHVMRANDRFKERKGNYFAAGLTYYTIFALFPLLMVGFAAIGFVLARQPDLLAQLENRIKASVSGNSSQQLIKLVNSAIAARGSVGIVGLAAATWAGLGWMSNLREALSEMWVYPPGSSNFVRTKLSDLATMMSAFAAIIATIALTALADASVMAKVLGWLHIHHLPLLDTVLGAVSWALSLLIAWLLFTWMIARLPRQAIGFLSCLPAGLIAAIGFEVFKQIASIYLRFVLRTPASATFGPVLGLMVFAYITARLILFATAWAATSPENLRTAPVRPPGPAVITTRVQTTERLSAGQALVAAAAGAVGALGLSRLYRRPRR